jgi:hypothetical protein
MDAVSVYVYGHSVGQKDESRRYAGNHTKHNTTKLKNIITLDEYRFLGCGAM